jgi:hypothetical protein
MNGQAYQTRCAGSQHFRSGNMRLSAVPADSIDPCRTVPIGGTCRALLSSTLHLALAPKLIRRALSEEIQDLLAWFSGAKNTNSPD